MTLYLAELLHDDETASALLVRGGNAKDAFDSLSRFPSLLTLTDDGDWCRVTLRQVQNVETTFPELGEPATCLVMRAAGRIYVHPAHYDPTATERQCLEAKARLIELRVRKGQSLAQAAGVNDVAEVLGPFENIRGEYIDLPKYLATVNEQFAREASGDERT